LHGSNTDPRSLLVKRLVVLAALSVFAAPAHAEQTRSYRTPAPLEDASACRANVACKPDLEGAPNARPATQVWSVRTSGAPPEEGYAQTPPVAIIADVDVDELKGDEHSDRPDRPHRPWLRRDPN
jgi:hypothetical protein